MKGAILVLHAFSLFFMLQQGDWRFSFVIVVTISCCWITQINKESTYIYIIINSIVVVLFLGSHLIDQL